MPNFKYEAIKKNGEKITGTISMPNETELRIYLRQIGARPSKIETESIFNKDFSFSFGSGVSEAEISIMTRQLAVMIGSGVPLLQSFDILLSGEKNLTMQKSLKSIVEAINAGSPLWEAMMKQKIFSQLYVYLIKAGEAGGALDQILLRLAKYLDDNVRLIRMVKGAMVYPAIVVLVGIGVTFGLLTFIVPKFAAMITASGGELPYLTALVIQISDFCTNYFLYIIGGAVGGFTSFFKYIKTPAGKRAWHLFLLNAPLFKDLLTKSATARFSRTLGTMLTSGVNLIDAIEICKMTIDNVIIEEQLAKVKEEISAGKTVAEPLAKAKIFPSMAIQMINVGESTGTLDQMLLKIADFYEAEVETTVGNMSKLIEPLILVILGGIVAFILIAMYLPVFNIANTQGG